MSQQQLAEQIFAGQSEMARLMRSHDWSQTLFDPIEVWPQSLRSSLSICLNSRFPIAIYWGLDCLLLYNDAWRPIVGDKHPWALGRPAREVWSEIWDNIGPELAGVLATGEGTFHKDDLLLMHRFGYTEECFFEYTFNPIQGQGGEIDGVFNVVSETTYRVLNERRAQLLREVASKTGVAKTIENACVLITEAFRSDPADIPFARLYLIDQDRKHAHLCSSTEPELDHSIGPTTIDLAGENNTDCWEIALTARTVQSHVITDLRSRCGELPGHPWPESPQEAIVLPIAAVGQDKVTGVLVAAASPRRKLDDSYRSFFEQMTGQVAVAIANAQAYEEERKRADTLAELDQAKTAFFSNVSHEFRTPLTLMLGPLEEMLSNAAGLNPGDREQLTTVHRNSLRLLKLVNTLLDFSRIEAGRIQAVYEPTDLATLTADLAGVFRSAIERAGLRLVVNCQPLSEPACVDREMWEKIVLNLLSNAFKFTFEGEIAVTLRSHPEGIELEIRDTGIGIPADELPYIFQRFHRVQGARGRTYEGSGIGLSLVQELVTLHGGTIQVSSVVDQGTSFSLSIPAGCAHLPSDRIKAARTLTSTAMGAMPYVEEVLRWLPEQSREGAESLDSAPSLDFYQQTRPFSGPKARILLADDNADMRDYLKRLLSQQYEVEAVTDGSAALAAARQQRPDLVLTDVMMPKLDGFGLLRELRTNPQTKELPIILLSARAGEESRIAGLEAGADDYLIKPFSARELLARVEATLKLAQIRQQAEAALRESEAQLRLFVTASSDIVYKMGADWSEMYLLKGKDFLASTENPSDTWLERYIPLEDQPEVLATIQAAIGTKGMFELEHRVIRLDGTIGWAFSRAIPLLNAQDEIVEWFGAASNITDRKQAEAALNQSSAILNIINQSTPTLIFVKDRQSRLQMGNPALMRALGKPEAEVIGYTDAEFYLNPDDAEAIMANDRQVMETGQMQVWEETLELTEGRRTFLSTKSPYTDETGTIIGLVGISFDITDRKQAEELARRTAALDAFRVSLADALRPLADPIEIQATASRLLGERLSANRVVYFEVRGTDYVVERDYVIDAEPLGGNYPIAPFGPVPLGAYRSGRTIVCSNIATDASLSSEEQSAYAAIEIGAHICIPLIKDGEFVAGLAVHTCGPRNWTPDDIALAEETAERTWAAVERARAEVALQVSEAKYRTLFELFDEGFCICEMLFDESGHPVDYRFLEVNSLFSQLTGLEQAAGKTARELVPDLETHWFETYGRVVKTGEPVRFENQSIAMNRWFEVNAFCVGKPQSNQFAVVFTNISDRKAAEQERERFLAVGSDLQVITGIDGYCRWVSPTFEKTLGWTVQEMTAYPWTWVIHPDDVSRSVLETERLFSGQETLAFENRFRHKDGSYRWLLWKAQPYLEEQVTYAAAVDITERKQAEELLQLSEERLRLATEAADIGMWFWNLIEDRLVWTEYCKRLFGLHPDTEMSYQRFLEALHPDDRDRTHAAVQQSIGQKQEYAIEYRSLWDDGSTHWILAKGRAFYTEQGKPIRMMGITQDITERKLAEATLQAQARELSQMNMQLVQTTTLVNQRNQELDQFAHIVSHDLKAPLRAISNLSQWIEEDLADQVLPETKQNLELLRSRVSRMEALINGLLTYARIGYQDTPDERFALNELLLEIVDSLDIPPEFTIKIPPNLPTLTTHRLLLNQVFTNLISNAVKHHDRPDGQIHITAQVEAQGYKFAVSDDGPGIAPLNHSKVFDIFQTLSSQSQKESTGIGLAIIKKIVERRGGQIDLESEVGQGATFNFTWPSSQPEANR